MRLQKICEEILVWQTGCKDNALEYQSTTDVNTYSRRKLSYIEDFLRENKELDEADKIKEYLGKILRTRNIPQVIPTGNYRADVPMYMWKRKFEEFVDDGLELNPEFQRGHVWNPDQRIKYVEFILQGGKTPPIYFNHEGWMRDFKGTFVIVDGKQRMTSLLMFLNKEFPVFKHLDDEGIGFYADEFNGHFGTNITYVVNDLKGEDKVLQWYLEMNQGYIQHSKEELDKVRGMIKREEI